MSNPNELKFKSDSGAMHVRIARHHELDDTGLYKYPYVVLVIANAKAWLGNAPIRPDHFRNQLLPNGLMVKIIDDPRDKIVPTFQHCNITQADIEFITEWVLTDEVQTILCNMISETEKEKQPPITNTNATTIPSGNV